MNYREGTVVSNKKTIITHLTNAQVMYLYLLSNFHVFDTIDRSDVPGIKNLYRKLVSNLISGLMYIVVKKASGQNLTNIALNHRGVVDSFVYDSMDIAGKTISFNTAYEFVNQIENALINDICGVLPEIDHERIVIKDYRFLDDDSLLITFVEVSK